MSSSPFDLLPVEIIQKIFLSSLPENNMTILPPKNLKKDTVQLAISQVSSRWRLIALGTFQLWDNVMLSPPNNPALRLASLWFHRARGLPITLNVQTHPSLPHDDPHIHDLCRLISSHRFKSLGGNPTNHWLLLHDKSYEESFASLDSLYLEFPIHPFQGRKSTSSDDYCLLPSLQYLHLNFKRFPVSRGRDLHMIPWPQLSTLTVHNATNFSTIIDIMRECKALVECKLLKFHADADVRVVSLATPLPHLGHLELSSKRPLLHLIKILSTFDMPNITSIHLAFTGEFLMDSCLTTDWLSRQLDAPFQQLQEITFSNPNKMLDVRMFLRRMPSLRRLALHGYVLLDHYTADEISTGKLGRHIDTISLRSCDSVGCVLDMIEKRQENAKSDKGRNLQPFIHVLLACPAAQGNKFKERAERLERQHNIRIKMEPGIVVGVGRY
ncbi:hypothetical protein JOM56_000580 [Amanita muscaria]